MEWLAWIYGRYFATLPVSGVLAGAAILGALIGAMAFYAMMARAIDIHREKQPQQVAAAASPAVEPKVREVTSEPPSAPPPLRPGQDEQPTGPPQQDVTRENQRAGRDNPRPSVTVNAPGGVVSLNQQGGITANTVIVGSRATYRLEMISANVPDGNRFRTELRIRLNTDATIGELRIGIFGTHVVDADVHPYDGQGPMQIQFGRGPGVQDGIYVVTIQNAYRGYTIVVFTTEPEELRFQVAQA